MNTVSDAESWLVGRLRFDHVGQVASGSHPLDWTQVVAVARRERLAAILLSRDAAVSFPADAYAQLEASRVRTRVTNALLLMQLEGWLNHFDAANISAIVLKGAALHAQVYGRSSLRPISDVDV
jgi:hypothetical protein